MTSVPVEAVSEEYIPTYSNPGDAGADLRYYGDDHTIDPGSRSLLDTGIRIAIPEGYVGLIHPRSGLAAKHGITVLNTPGTIDSGYRGPLKVILYNASDTPYTVKSQERIAQLVIQAFETATFFSMGMTEDTVRGSGGFGSTGKA